MTQLATKTSIHPVAASLSVSYNSTVPKDQLEKPMREVVIITDPHFTIKGFNDIAAVFYAFDTKAARGQQLFSLVQFEMIGTCLEEAMEGLFKNGYWKGDIMYNHSNKKIIFSTRCTLILDDTGATNFIVISARNISERLKQEKELAIAETKYQALVESLSEGVMLINADSSIGAANKRAIEILGFTEAEIKGTPLTSTQWNAVKEDGGEFLKADFPALITLQTGRDNNNVVMGIWQKGGTKKKWISINSRAIFDLNKSVPVGAVVSFVDITEVKEINERISESETLFRTFMKDSPTLGWIYDEDGMLVYGNPRFLDIIGLTADAKGKNIAAFTKSAEVLASIVKRNNEVLQNGKTIIVKEAIADKDGNMRYYLSYWFLLPAKNNKRLIGGHAVEITDKKHAQHEIDKMYERYYFAINASSEAVWDMDITTGSIYRSDTFSQFSGYKKEDIIPSLDWFFEKIHPGDKNRVKVNVDYCLNNNVTNWENEYRFQIADGTYRHLLDKAHAIYEDAKPTRVIGAMQDITERKKLSAQLLQDQVQKQKMISQATIKAQEKERNRISGELHDNVNQLLMCAKLHICVAINKGATQADLLDKANEYLLMAVEEIRGISKSLTSTLITHVGLQKSIADIASSMLLLQNIQLHTYISDEVVAKLSAEQQLMVYRIIQEQSNNILKYAETSEAIISIKQIGRQVELIISDIGKGFDKSAEKTNGIGFINIFNRVDAYNGKVDIITSPGKGCTLIINFPLTEL